MIDKCNTCRITDELHFELTDLVMMPVDEFLALNVEKLDQKTKNLYEVLVSTSFYNEVIHNIGFFGHKTY